MLARVFSAAVVGLDGLPIEVEVDIASQGLPSFTIVGLPDKAVEEAKERVRSAIRNTGADFPSRRITVNLAPADLPKMGPAYDLPIALGILLASEQLKNNLEDAVVIGELSLDGRIRPASGVLPFIIMAKDKGFKEVILPLENSKEASLIDGLKIYAVSNLENLLKHLTGEKQLEETVCIPLSELLSDKEFAYDLADIKGQHQAKRALEIAAAGGHNILMKGPPGAGKTLLSRTLPSILPQLTFPEALEVTKIYSVAGLLDQESIIAERPFRAPHHTTSLAGIIGGSSNPRPGELTLAHRGILFLDEFPEFPRSVLEALRQPIEDGHVTISRANGKIKFPTKCMLVAAYNPCPCGFLGDTKNKCRCTSSQILRYQKKLSGPILDRIDIHLDIPAVDVNKLSTENEESENSKTVRKRVQNARNIQTKRFKDAGINMNSEMSTRQVKTFCFLSKDSREILKTAADKLNLSARAYFRTLKVARTIADLDKSEGIKPSHLAEALQYRPRQALSSLSP